MNKTETVEDERFTDNNLYDELRDMMRRMWGLHLAVKGLQEDHANDREATGVAALAYDVAEKADALFERWCEECESRRLETKEAADNRRLS